MIPHPVSRSRFRAAQDTLALVLLLGSLTLLGLSAPTGPDPTTIPTRTGYFAHPLGNGPVSTLHAFDRPARNWLPGHRGVDLAAAVGTPILAPADGQVTFSGTVVDRAVLVMTHDLGMRSSFEPVVAAVPAGTIVRRGDSIATLAASPGHCEPSSCLHWGVRLGEEYLDPLSLLRRVPAILLPWE